MSTYQYSASEFDYTNHHSGFRLPAPSAEDCDAHSVLVGEVDGYAVWVAFWWPRPGMAPWKMAVRIRRPIPDDTEADVLFCMHVVLWPDGAFPFGILPFELHTCAPPEGELADVIRAEVARQCEAFARMEAAA